MTDTQTIIQKGIVQSLPKKGTNSASNIVAKPAEIDIFARSLTVGERFLYPFVKN
jgi:hypothetical protein